MVTAAAPQAIESRLHVMCTRAEGPVWNGCPECIRVDFQILDGPWENRIATHRIQLLEIKFENGRKEPSPLGDEHYQGVRRLALALGLIDNPEAPLAEIAWFEARGRTCGGLVRLVDGELRPGNFEKR